MTQQVCKSCLWKKQESVFKWPSIASADFPWDKSYVVDKWGIKMVDCSRCKGTGLEPVFEKQVISKKETTDELIEKRENEKETDNKDWCYKYDWFYDMFISDLKSLTQSYEQKQVRCYRCNCECWWHNIKYEYKFCPDCWWKIIFE